MGLIDKLGLKPAEEEDDSVIEPISVSKEYTNKTILVEPRAFSEAFQVADYLKANNQVVVNFKRVTSDVSKRIMDFLNGIVYAIEGNMEKLGPGIVLCAPKGFEIEGNISEDDNKKSSKKESTEEW